MIRVSRLLVVFTLALLGLGIVMLFSTSSVRAAMSYHEPQYFVKRQLVWAFIAMAIGAVVARFDYHWWQRPALLFTLGGISVMFLVLVFVPHIGPKIGGSHRWIKLGFLSFQPSEIAKFTVIVMLAAWMVAAERKVQSWKQGLAIPVAILGVVVLLILGEPDFGTTLLTGVVGLAIMFVGGMRIAYLLGVGALGATGFVAMVIHDPVRLMRVLAFLQPEKYPDKSYHLLQSLVAIIRGGLTGVGLGNSLQKQFYLPESHTDFIMAIVGEELGFLGTLSVVLLFFGILVCGMIISQRAPDLFGKLLAFGFTTMLVLQAAINVGVVTGCLPTKGLPLPFISYGGSSLVISVASVAVLLNIAGHWEEGDGDAHTRTIKDKTHQFSA